MYILFWYAQNFHFVQPPLHQLRKGWTQLNTTWYNTLSTALLNTRCTKKIHVNFVVLKCYIAFARAEWLRSFSSRAEGTFNHALLLVFPLRLLCYVKLGHGSDYEYLPATTIDSRSTVWLYATTSQWNKSLGSLHDVKFWKPTQGWHSR